MKLVIPVNLVILAILVNLVNESFETGDSRETGDFLKRVIPVNLVNLAIMVNMVNLVNK